MMNVPNENIQDLVRKYFKINIVWSHTNNPELQYQANVDKDKLVLRINDFPDEPLYTLVVNDLPLTSFSDWPENWKR
ncbi:hypothetical protein HY485_02315 [Candidatus Woesearchaeota archaeon]|nr:hypothetical protein [Candidatus Woesearchaeota archaeon]